MSDLHQTEARTTEATCVAVDIDGRSLPALLAEAERKIIAWAMTETQGNQAQAARLIGISYNTFKAKLSRHDLRAKWS